MRVAIVTGGGGGIGGAIAHRLAEDGLDVAVADLRLDAAEEVAAAISAAGGRARPYAMDVADGASVDGAHRTVVEAQGPVDVLVNCAGWDVARLFVDTDEAFWDRIIEINFKGVLRTTSCVLPGMMERGWGRIVNIASDAARVGSSMESVYSGAKGAVVAFTKTIARESVRRGVTANCVCPGPTDTALLRDVFAGHERAASMGEALVRAVPMRRLGQPADIAPAVSYLVSDGASYVTGQTISVSGGLTMA